MEGFVRIVDMAMYVCVTHGGAASINRLKHPVSVVVKPFSTVQL